MASAEWSHVPTLHSVHKGEHWPQGKAPVITGSLNQRSNFRYADDTTLSAEMEEEPKSLLIKVKEKREIADLKLNVQKTKIVASGPITSWQIYGETVSDFILGAPKSL